jgi:hypothetical protein
MHRLRPITLSTLLLVTLVAFLAVVRPPMASHAQPALHLSTRAESVRIPLGSGVAGRGTVAAPESLDTTDQALLADATWTVPTTGAAQTTAAQTTVCGAITQPETWDPSGNPYIVTCSATVSSGVTLTIAAGRSGSNSKWSYP